MDAIERLVTDTRPHPLFPPSQCAMVRRYEAERAGWCELRSWVIILAPFLLLVLVGGCGAVVGE